MNRTRRNLLSFVFYLPLAVLGYLFSTPEATQDFDRVAKEFRVMAMRDGKPVAATLATLPKPGPGITYLLPGKIVEIPGGDLHKASVLESSPHQQLVQYDFGNTVDTRSRYRAFRDRVEPVSHRIEFHPGIVVTMIVLVLPAWLLAFAADWLFGRMTGTQAPPGQSAAPPADRVPSRLDKAMVWIVVAAIVLVVVFAVVLRYL